MSLDKLVRGGLIISGLIGSTAFFVACKGDNAAKEAQAKANQVKPYNVISLERQSVTLFADYPATLQGIRDIDIRPKIDGYIEKVFVDEGQSVSAGQVLFTINNPQYAQDVNNTRAAIASAEAAVATARLQVKKTKPLVDQDIISPYEYESAELNLKAKEAALTQARAVYNNSKINQGYTTVTSPVSGLVGTIPYRIGSYVNASALPLTTVSDISRVYAYFSMNEKQQLSFYINTPGATVEQKLKQMPAVSLLLSNTEEYPAKGKLESISGQANTQTGSYNVRATFPNDQRLLRSGSSAVVRIPTYVDKAIIIPQKATTELQDKRLAYIVADSNKVKAVPIKVREVPGGKFFVVDEGLKESDQLIVEGVGLLTEGTVIKPTLIPADSALKAFDKK
ncbi:MAG: efflux transporter periplasmic adaptor subunit [Bacteroidetes bacterium 43-16]|nr:MAG: efflux transporter periplasmic adaptor subunit [Bacteroidetes bacterium 43-16]